MLLCFNYQEWVLLSVIKNPDQHRLQSFIYIFECPKCPLSDYSTKLILYDHVTDK